MHELSICNALLTQAEAVAREHGAAGIVRIAVAVGPLSGVEPELLARAFTIARAGTIAASAVLHLRVPEVVVRCTACGVETTVPPQRLVCGGCGGWRTRVVTGDELVLEQLELRAEVEAHV